MTDHSEARVAIDSHNVYREQAAYVLGALSVLAGAQPEGAG